eukprot:120413-Lingulodinium_polyedra.AAC.1
MHSLARWQATSYTSAPSGSVGRWAAANTSRETPSKRSPTAKAQLQELVVAMLLRRARGKTT